MSENAKPRERKSSKHDRNRPPRWRSPLVLVAATIVACVYLFVTAPPPLVADAATRADALPVRTVFAMLQAENQAARALWTEEIVSRGKAAGLTFDEHWRDPGVQAGPLPSLFLRQTAQHLEQSGLHLGLFLGSPFPINAANRFSGDQERRFEAMQPDGAPQFFFDDSTRRYTAMFADRAVSEACIACHNAHPDSPKRDWTMHAIMGATTWIYPEATVSRKRALEMIGQLRASIRATYTSYLQKVATFSERPAIGEKWPRDGFYLPSADVFMRELARRSSPITLSSLLDPNTAEAAAEPAEAPAAPAHAAAAAEPARPANTATSRASAKAAAKRAKPATPPPAAARAATSLGVRAIAPPGARAAAWPAARETTSPPARTTARYPTLVIRAVHSARVTIERAGRKLMVARIPAGGSTSLSAKPPLHITLSDRRGIAIEYGGTPVALPDAAGASARSDDVEVTLAGQGREKS